MNDYLKQNPAYGLSDIFIKKFAKCKNLVYNLKKNFIRAV